ncbi:ATP phosphoribosyltransferase regulatory subunit [Paucilactobacillus suebicus]|uniref:ATP phosphoribosyltransferase regulatory subunit n=1 Tax=Paucilactobacillus suebicus DSM 5007 = KCTC 3549 TaxID=1423807 RepID=A0A0R1WBN5_9LACO|nr:ATP phosphoribosyltransferase regulatory subunit [Paucilactobacillus suebicus]KRM12355.1 histidine--tRNA ligase [Paucilactobacillus suebicus DSM 5007 = KCTC 3549]
MMRNQLPTGVRDELGDSAQIKEQIVYTIQNYLKNRGFDKVITPVVEYQDVFEDYDAGQKKLFKFLASDGNMVVLRPDMTLPVARVVSSTNISLPAKFYYSGDIFRINRALSGSQDEMTQAGAELIGFDSIKAEQECLVMMMQLSEKLELTGVQIELGIARFALLILESFIDDESQIKEIESALFQKQITQYNKLIEPFADNELYPLLQIWPRLFGPTDEVLDQISDFELPAEIQAEIKELKQLVKWMADKFPAADVQIDLSAKAPQDYYTGITFQAFSAKSSSYLFSGGRYDHLMAHFQNKNVAAIGLGIDIERLVEINQAGKQKQQRTFIYFDDAQWDDAEQKLTEIPNSQLCLADNLEQAKQIVKAQDGKLLDLSGGD